jgi:tetratricopeptide (TPR) repeat protein
VPHPATPLSAVSPRSDGGAQAALDTLTQLIDKSLVRVDERDDQTRYFLLETVREYALEKLAAEGQTTSARDRHLAFYTSLVEQAGSELHRANQKYWFTCLDLEHDNVRTALDWAAQRQDVPALWRLIAGLWWFWFRRGHWREGVDRTKIARSLDDGARSLAQARALVGAATLAGRNGDYELFRAWLSEGAQLAEEHGDSVYLAWARLNQSIHTGDYIRAKALLEDGLALARAAGDIWLVADLFFILGDRARGSGLGADAAAYYAQSVAHFRRVGDRDMVAYPLGNFGRLALSRGDYAEARAAFEESVAMCREMGNKLGIADWLIQLGRVALHQADEASAQAAQAECLALCRETGNASGLGDGLTIAVELALRRGQPERAARWLAVADGLYEQFAMDQRVIEPGRYAEHAHRLTIVRAELDERAFQAAWAAGRALSISEAIEEVLG